ncbi:hypothetical protein B0H14DRAFT_3499027 [Mycena olivaceomarginata]|nr:hypothetical protein B0H14DRAFT_3499027 [Mycena olivaceomarginata]
MLFAVCLVHHASALAVRDIQLSPLILRSGGRRAVTNGNTVFTLTSNGIIENASNVRVSGLSLTPTHLILALLVAPNKYHRQRPQFSSPHPPKHPRHWPGWADVRHNLFHQSGFAVQGAKLDESLGELLLSKIFDQKPDQQNFIGGSADASSLVNEVDQDYADVVFASAIPLISREQRAMQQDMPSP